MNLRTRCVSFSQMPARYPQKSSLSWTCFVILNLRLRPSPKPGSRVVHSLDKNSRVRFLYRNRDGRIRKWGGGVALAYRAAECNLKERRIKCMGKAEALCAVLKVLEGVLLKKLRLELHAGTIWGFGIGYSRSWTTETLLPVSWGSTLRRLSTGWTTATASVNSGGWLPLLKASHLSAPSLKRGKWRSPLMASSVAQGKSYVAAPRAVFWAASFTA